MAKNFKSLTIKEKLEYIWDYYKLHITVTIIMIGLITSIIIGINSKIDYKLYCLVFNDSGNTVLENHIKDTYSQYIHSDKKYISVDMGYTFSPNEEKGLNWPDEGSAVKYVQLQTSREADVLITDYDSMLWAQSEAFLTPVDEILSNELYAQLEPYFVYAVFNDSTDQHGDGNVYGLDISDTEIYKGHSFQYEDAIVCFPNVSKNPEAAVKFVKYLYGITSETK